MNDIIRKVLVVDDDALLRSLLCTQLREWGFDAREAESSRTAIQQCRSFDPDAVILDVDLGAGPNGFQLAEALGRSMTHLAIVFLTRFPDARASISRMSPSLRGAAFVNKNSVENSGDLLFALNAALSDQGGLITQQSTDQQPLQQLTRLQLDVLRMMHDGNTNAQIAAQRGTTTSAVDNIVGRIFRTLQIDSSAKNPRATAVRLYAENYGFRSG